MSTQLVILGGFLGSGKTTLMLDLAGQYGKKGLKTAIITNDQGDLLVDTNTAMERGFPVKQVSSGCFCCKFSEFIENIEAFLNDVKPDIILAEPVGSCTDLVSTLAAPLQNFHADKIELKGIYILVDAYRALNSYSGMDLVNPGTPEEVLLSHQIGEAGVLLLSKTDMLDDHQITEAEKFLKFINDRAEIIPYSVQNKKQTASIGEMILNRNADDLLLQSVALDYDVYAVAEAELGWYNGSWEFRSDHQISLSGYLAALSGLFHNDDLGTVSHGKILMITKDSSIKLSFVEGIIRSETVQGGSDSSNACRVLLNIRAKSHPDTIVGIVERNIKELDKQFQGNSTSYIFKSLIPSPPKPEHRIQVQSR